MPLDLSARSVRIAPRKSKGEAKMVNSCASGGHARRIAIDKSVKHRLEQDEAHRFLTFLPSTCSHLVRMSRRDCALHARGVAKHHDKPLCRLIRRQLRQLARGLPARQQCSPQQVINRPPSGGQITKIGGIDRGENQTHKPSRRFCTPCVDYAAVFRSAPRVR